MKKHLLVTALIAASFSAQSDNGLSRPDSHAPIGVMGDHTHAKGEWMFSYRFMQMDMEGNRDGNNELRAQDVRDRGFMVAPLSMTMDMHMLGAMYAPTDNITLMTMVPFVSMEMDHAFGPALDMNFQTKSSSIGDIKLGALFSLNKTDATNTIFNLSLSLPTGSIDEEDVLPNSMGVEVQLPYPMQIGSGTYDLTYGLTYTALEESFSWGLQGKGTLRMGDNDNDYRLGNRYTATTWAAKPLSDHFSVSARLAYEDKDNIQGADTELGAAPTFVPTANPRLRGGKRTDFGVGVNYILGGSGVNNHRIALEYLTPAFQNLDGPQLETDSVISIGYQVAL